MSVHSASNGSYYPDNSIVEHQLRPELYQKENREYIEEKFDLITKKTVKVWDQTVVDLPRLGKFQIDQKELYNSSKNTRLTSQEVLDEIDLRLQDEETTKNVANFLQQDLNLSIRFGIMKQKGMLKKEDQGEITTHHLNAKEKVAIIKYEPKTFFKSDTITIIHELLFQVRPDADPEKTTFFKAKSIISGPKAAFKEKKAQQITVETAYTSEYPNAELAKKSNYFGTAVGGLSNYESYIQ